jgi:hypothetical protein
VTVKQIGAACLVGLLMWCVAFLLLMQAFSYINSLY